MLAVKCAPEDRPTLLPPLLALGIPATWRPGTSTSTFSFRYDGDRRLMEVDALGDAWTPEEATGWVEQAISPCEWVHVGPLARSDFPAETLAALAKRHRISLDAQGLVRAPRTGPLVLDADLDPEVLRHVSVLKLAEEEASALGCADEAGLGRLGVPEVVLTFGSRGALVYANGRVEQVPTRAAAGPVDPTGAGDAFAAAYLTGRIGGLAPAAAAHHAGVVVAGLLTVSGR